MPDGPIFCQCHTGSLPEFSCRGPETHLQIQNQTVALCARTTNQQTFLAGFFFIAVILVAVVGFSFQNHGFAGTAYAFTAQAFNLRGFVILYHLQNGHVLWYGKLAS